MNSSETPIVAVILAAGKGTRMKSSRAKALFPLCGKPLASYPIRTAHQAGIDRTILVIGHQADEVRAAIGDGVEYAVQSPQLGTGHALMCTEEALKGFSGTIFVHCVDVPLLPASLLQELLRTHRESGNAATMLTARMADPGKYGRIIRMTTGDVARIVEARDATDAELAINEINAGTYCFEAPLIFEVLHEITPNNDQHEYYLTDVIERLIARGQRVGAVVAPDEKMVAGINDRVQLADAETNLRQEIRCAHMRNGVTIIDPASTFIDEDVEIGQDTTIYPFTMIFAGTKIGENCTIGPSSQLFEATIEDNAEVISSRVEKSIIRTGGKVGPFSRLRPNCEVGPGAQVGNFSEMKNTKVGTGSKVHHVGYLGDTTLGEGVNIGAGTITCNYDGKRKHPTHIGDKVFIGSGSLIVAPINIGETALTGAGSVVTRDIPAGKVAYGVPAKVVREREVE
ncbi:MAG TPA: bifunctional UDP-N-acetylglucosamine diphosphorylase/glucosamine-1-phosphate N-acetyltransferase GlmU [Armatimonadota bacterium]|nr:bifunctional UDP-N-acetylglucosamine diphosphorylase/glucosamine-1-phosphate N-acetyltransferase GlmU [Armatimonadota bacterium]